MPPSSKPPFSSDPPESGSESPKLSMDEKIYQWLGELSPEERGLLLMHVNIDAADRNRPRALIMMFGESYSILAANVQSTIEEFDSSYDEVSATILLRIEELEIASPTSLMVERGGTEEKPAAERTVREPVQKVVVPVIEEVDVYAHTLSSSAPPASSLPQAAPENAAHKIEVDISHPPLSAEMTKLTNKEFVGVLTDEGKEMLRELLLLRDIWDAVAVNALEEKHGKIGFVKLSMHVADRLSSSVGRQELCKALKCDEDGTAAFSRIRRIDEKLTIPAFAKPAPAASASSPQASLDELCSEYSEEEWVRLEQELSGNTQTSSQLTARYIKAVIDSGMKNPSTDDLKKALLERMPTELKQEIPVAYLEQTSSRIISTFAESSADINQFVDDLEDPIRVALRDHYLGGLNKAPKKLAGGGFQLADNHQEMLEAIHLVNRLAAKLKKREGYSDELLTNAISVRLRGGHVERDNLQSKVIISPKVDSNQEDSMVVSKVRDLREVLGKIFNRKRR